jgi:hypothetical protein
MAKTPYLDCCSFYRDFLRPKVVLSRVFGPFQWFVSGNPYNLAVKILAILGDAEELATLFSIMQTTGGRIPFARDEFCSFLSSIFEALMTVTSENCLRESLCYAKELIEFCIFPSDEAVVSLRKGGGKFCKEVDSYARKSDEEACMFLYATIKAHGIWEMPLYMYEGVGRLLLRLHKNDLIIATLARCLPRLESVSFATKACFVKPIACKLKFLHRAFVIGIPNFELLKANPKEFWEVSEDSKGDFRNLRIFIGDLHVMGIFEVGASPYENVLNNWSEAFKVWVQGGVVSKLLNRDKEQIPKKEQCIAGDPSVSKDSSKGEENANENIFERVQCDQIPENDQIAQQYVDIYNDDDDDFGFLCGVLALKYYLSKKPDEIEALQPDLLPGLVKAVRDLPPGSDLLDYFTELINCKSASFSWGKAVEIIIHNAQSAKLNVNENDRDE